MSGGEALREALERIVADHDPEGTGYSRFGGDAVIKDLRAALASQDADTRETEHIIGPGFYRRMYGPQTDTRETGLDVERLAHAPGCPFDATATQPECSCGLLRYQRALRSHDTETTGEAG